MLARTENGHLCPLLCQLIFTAQYIRQATPVQVDEGSDSFHNLRSDGAIEARGGLIQTQEIRQGYDLHCYGQAFHLT